MPGGQRSEVKGQGVGDEGGGAVGGPQSAAPKEILERSQGEPKGTPKENPKMTPEMTSKENPK